MDHYIHKQAGQDIKRSISRIFVAEQSGNSKEMLGYYSLRTLSIELSQLPENLTRKLPRHPIPAALIGRLAVKKDTNVTIRLLHEPGKNDPEHAGIHDTVRDEMILAERITETMDTLYPFP